MWRTNIFYFDDGVVDQGTPADQGETEQRDAIERETQPTA